MKNITLSVDEAVLVKVRKYAAEAETSVNALVREYLQALSEKHDRARAARARLRELSETSSGRVGERRWQRDELHAR